MGFLLWILSQILGILLLPIGLIYGLFNAIYKRRFFKHGLPTINKKFLKLATAFDVFGNSACCELFNATLITKESKHLFGSTYETISEVLGYNLVGNTLTKTGRVIVSLLNFFEKEHCLKAIDRVAK